MKRILSLVALSIITTLSVFSQDYIAIGKPGSAYDDASTKYITVNQDNENVNVIPGMVFVTSQHLPGWYKIEYSPGLHAFIPEQIVAINYNVPKPGTYAIKNNPGQSITINNDNGNWAASLNGKTYAGSTKDNNIIIFVDDSNNKAFSLVDLGDGGIVINYDNAVTKFF